MRFVNTATAQWIASARCSSSACEETSITQAPSPPASICANVACRSIASGVVRTAGAATPPTTCSTVPSRPVRVPVASSSARVRKPVVVLPLVPVMPTTASRAVGSPFSRAATGAIAARTSSTTTSGTPRPSGRCTTSATAPRSIACGAKSCPSRVNPGTQKKRLPGLHGARVVGERRHLDLGRRRALAVAQEVPQQHRPLRVPAAYDGGIRR